MIEIVIGVLIVILVAVYVAILIRLSNKVNNMKPETKPDTAYTMERMKLLLDMDNPVDKIEKIIDEIIKSCITLYRIQNPSLDGEYQYIMASEVEESLLPYVYFMTMKSMTPEVVSILSLIYNFQPFDINIFLKTTTLDNYKPDQKNTNTLEWIIYTKVKLAVINYTNLVNS